jgi:2-amino-4-hydroxy-6-hydroxymethyldihydropteridine diphosphokinase
MVRAWIALGSNLGERAAYLDLALRELARTPHTRVLRRSTWHETDPVGGPAGQGRYLNGVAELETSLSARTLLERCLAIEREAGRTRGARDGPRTLDIDLLLFGDERIDEPDLRVPHPRLEERTFVLAPLCELAPDMALPRSGTTVAERLAQVLARDGARGHAAPR